MRDMDLVRALLLRIEQIVPHHGLLEIEPEDEEISIEGYTPEQIVYHFALLSSAGFVDGEVGAREQILLRKVTWKGYEFLDSVRDPDVWRRTKEGAKKAGGFTLEILAAAAQALIKKKMESFVGVEIA